jgi:hypothetical protein
MKTNIENPIINVTDRAVQIRAFTTDDSDVVRHLSAIPEDALPEAVERTLRVGSICLLSAQSSLDVQVLQGAVDRVISEMSQTVGTVPDQLKERLLEELDPQKGKALQPVTDAVARVALQMERELEKVKLMADPDNPESKPGKILTHLQNLLDPMRKDSLQNRFSDALDTMSDQDGGLAKLLDAVLAANLKPVQDQIEKLQKQVAKDEGFQEAVELSTLKGKSFEEALLDRLVTFAQSKGGRVEHVGPANKPGDFVVKFDRSGLLNMDATIVVEAKDHTTSKGHKQVAAEIMKELVHYGADYGIYVTKTSAALAREIGEFASGTTPHGPYIACTLQYVENALMQALGEIRLKELKRKGDDFDLRAMEEELELIQSSMKRLTQAKKHITEIEKLASKLRSELECHEDQVDASLTGVHKLLAPLSAPA